MSAMASEGLSSEELRAHLFRSLQGSGVVDSLKVGHTRAAMSLSVASRTTASPSRPVSATQSSGP